MTDPDHFARLLVRPASAVPRAGEPLTAGVPFPCGQVRDVSELAVFTADGHPCPSAARATERWSDGSLRWVLVDLQADVPAAGTALDVRRGTALEGSTPLTVRCDGRTAAVTTAGVAALFDVSSAPGLAELTLDGVTMTGRPALAWSVRDAAGAACAIAWSELDASDVTPLSARILLRGRCTTGDGRPLHVAVSWRFFAGRAAVAVDVELHNPSRAAHPGGFWELGDAGSILVRDARVTVSAPAAALPAIARARIDSDASLEALATPLLVTQHASGGAHWQSLVHVTADGTLPFAERGYVVTTGGDRRTGLRASPTLTVASEAGPRLSVTAPRFWQVFPKAFGVTPDGDLTIAWLPEMARPHEIQGGERCHFAFALGFGGEAVTDTPLEWLRAPSIVLPDPETAAAADVVPGLVAASAVRDAAYDAFVVAGVDGDDSFVAKRERVDEYGWRHFGDLYADHENGADPSLRRVSHYNNQYDAVAGFIVQALRTGDVRWWTLADELADHVAHVDIYWTDEDKAAYNGGLFWHTTHYVDAGRSTHRTYPRAPGAPSGGPSNEHCYTTGLRLHHRLTGAPLSAAGVERLADWLAMADDGVHAPWPLPWLSRARTGYASATASLEFHGPGRGAANAVHAMLDAWRLTGRTGYRDKAREIVERVVHPDQDVGALALPDTERRWSYTVMLQALGRYEAEMRECGQPSAADYARATLLRYAAWMAANEFPYLDRPEILEFPTETWAAQDLRKAAVFDLAAWHAIDAASRARFAERARFFHHTALETLRQHPTRTRTRPMVLVLVNGYARAWHERHGGAAPVLPAPAGAWTTHARFVPQRTRAVRRLVGMAVAVAAVLLLGLAVLLG